MVGALALPLAGLGIGSVEVNGKALFESFQFYVSGAFGFEAIQDPGDHRQAPLKTSSVNFLKTRSRSLISQC